ncbi:MAG TPA: hypothetical protein VGY31_16595 [Terriglobia bacterium]|nr:hypothetical protein [Terriglobia bacterium]
MRPSDITLVTPIQLQINIPSAADHYTKVEEQPLSEFRPGFTRLIPAMVIWD